jgi:phosphatidylglycerophosphate synthase
MHDYTYAIVLISLAGLALTTYGWRVVRRGAARFDRVDTVGGSALLSKRLVEMGYWAMQPLARGCVRAGITPNHLSVVSFLLGVGSGVALAWGNFGLGALFALTSALSDVLDGQVARLTKTGSAAGEVFDASVDRYTEFFCLGGLAVFYRDVLPLMLLAMLALLAAVMVSYATAKAEAMQLTPPKGAMRRHERAAYLIAGATFSSLSGPWIDPMPGWPHVHGWPMVIALAILGVAGNWSAARRLWLVYRTLRDRERIEKGGAG